jgi:hypothetical protein
MSFALDTTEDIGGGESTYLDQPGTYHCLVTSVGENQGPKGGHIDGFTVHLAVLAGTVPGQKDKQKSLCLFSPDKSKPEEKQKWPKKKQTAFAIATEVIKLGEKKLGGVVDVDLQLAVGRQLVITFEANEYEGKTNLELAYDNIYHIDDPRAAKFPKDAEAIALATKEMQRQPPEYFAKLLEKPDAKAGQSRLSQNDLADL